MHNSKNLNENIKLLHINYNTFHFVNLKQNDKKDLYEDRNFPHFLWAQYVVISRVYSKSHRAIEQVNSSARNYTRTVNTLPPDCVDEQTDEEELDDDNLASEDIPLEVAGSVEIEYESDDDDDEEETLVSSLANRKLSSQIELKWKKWLLVAI